MMCTIQHLHKKQAVEMEIVEIEGIKKIALLPHNQENIHYLCGCVSFFLAQFVIIINIFILLFVFFLLFFKYLVIW